MAYPFRARLEIESASDTTFSDKVTKDGFTIYDSTTALETVSHEQKFATSVTSSASINFGGVAVARAVLVRSPVKFGVKFNGATTDIPARTLLGSAAALFMTGSITSLTVVKRAAASVVVSVRLWGT